MVRLILVTVIIIFPGLAFTAGVTLSKIQTKNLDSISAQCDDLAERNIPIKCPSCAGDVPIDARMSMDDYNHIAEHFPEFQSVGKAYVDKNRNLSRDLLDVGTSDDLIKAIAEGRVQWTPLSKQNFKVKNSDKTGVGQVFESVIAITDINGRKIEKKIQMLVCTSGTCTRDRLEVNAGQVLTIYPVRTP